VIQSQLILPSFQVLPAGYFLENAGHQITIFFGSVSQKGLSQPLNQGLTYQATATEFWLNIPFMARFLVSNGQNIIIDPVPGIDEESIRVFLLSTCLEVLLKQRQMTVIQGYALKLNDQGVVFAGNLGTGQSMLQGLLYKRGHIFLSGNFFALNNQGYILPGVAQLEFWQPVVSALGFAEQSLKMLRPNINKYIIPLEEQYYAKPLPLKVIYTWKTHQQGDIIFSPIDDANKKQYLQQLIKANNLPVGLWPEQHDNLCNSAVLDAIQIVCIQLPIKGLKLQQLVDSIENDLVERGHYYV